MATLEFYVHAGTGSNGNDGLSAGTAWAELDHALDNITSAAGDDIIIYCLGGQDTRAAFTFTFGSNNATANSLSIIGSGSSAQQFDTSGYYLDVTNGRGLYLRNIGYQVNVSDFQVRVTGNPSLSQSSWGLLVGNMNAGSNVNIQRCRVQCVDDDISATGQVMGGISINDSDLGNSFVNFNIVELVLGAGTGAGTHIGFDQTNGTVETSNNTVWGVWGTRGWDDGGAPQAPNVAIGGIGAGSAADAPNFLTSAVDTGQVYANATQIADWTVEFENPTQVGGGDFRLKTGSAVLAGGGTDVSASNGSTTDTDIDGVVITGPWPIGASHLAAAGDTTAPTYGTAPAVTAGPTNDGATVSSTASDETDSAVEKAYVVLASAAAAPATGEDVFNQTGNAATPLASGSLIGPSEVSNGVQSDFVITGLGIGTFDYYEAIRDSAGNYLLASVVSFTTVGVWSSDPVDQAWVNGVANSYDLSALATDTVTLVSAPAGFSVVAESLDYDGSDQPSAPSGDNAITVVAGGEQRSFNVRLSFATAAAVDFPPGSGMNWGPDASPLGLLFGEPTTELDTYDVTGVPVGLQIILAAGGAFTANDTGIGLGTHPFTVRWLDHETGNITSIGRQVVIADLTPPAHSAGPVTANVTDTALDIQGTLDESGDIRVLVVADGAGQPSDAAFDAVTPVGATNGVQYTFSISGLSAPPFPRDAWVEARDAVGNRSHTLVNFDLVNNPPTVANPIPDQGLTNGTAFTYTVPANTFADDDALVLTAQLVGGAALSTVGLAFDGSSFSGTLADDAVAQIEVIATDTGAQAITDPFQLTMSAAPDVTAPSHTAGPTASNVTEDSADIGGTLDENADVRIIIVDDNAGQPSEAAFDGVTPTAAALGYTINLTGITGGPGALKDAWIEARDAAGNRGTVKLDFTLANNLPTVANPVPDQNLTNGTAFTYTVPGNTFTDTDALVITARLVGGAALSTVGLSFDGSSFSGTLTDDTTADIEVIATDTGSQTVSDIFVLTMSAAPNQPPVLDNAITDITAQAGAPWTYQWPINTFSDPDGDTMTHPSEVTGGAALSTVGITYVEGTRTYSATAPVQTVSIDLYADDGQANISETFVVDFTLQAPNLIGALSNLSLTEGVPMTPVDLSLLANGLPDTYASIGAALPAGITLTGSVLSGIPTAQGSTPGVQFRISNAAGQVDTATIVMDVAAPSASSGGGSMIFTMFLDG